MVFMKIDVVAAPAFLQDEQLHGQLCAVVDVLRATSTIIVALASGALEVRPCMDAAEARERAAGLGKVRFLLGGEEKGQRIPGFDLGNSPLEYLPTETIAGKILLLSTTNGSGTIRKAHVASGLPVYIAALLNASAVSLAIMKAAISTSIGGIAIICSGRCGQPADEDFFCAGLLADQVSMTLLAAGIEHELTDGARIAAAFAQAKRESALSVLRESEHGRYLKSIGFAEDIDFASALDRYDITPVFDGERIVLANSKP